MFDHPQIVDYLLQEVNRRKTEPVLLPKILQNSNCNVTDLHHRTPLILAAMRGGECAIQRLLQNGADITIRDSANRNVLHYIVSHTFSHSSKAGVSGKLTQILRKIVEV